MKLLIKKLRKISGGVLLLIFSVTIFASCATTPATQFIRSDGSRDVLEQLMARKNRIVHLSPTNFQNKPALLVLHGATEDPGEMIEIVREWKGTYDVFLYSYNYHQSAEKVADALVGEMKRLRARNEISTNLTVVNYSYSAIIFRAAVILAHGETVFSGASLIQLVPTSGGSFLARDMGYFPGLVSFFSKPSAALYPFSDFANELWEGEGNRKFFEVIRPERMHSILLEGDWHSLAKLNDERVRLHYQNGIGENVVVIPKSTGVNHEYFPTNPIALGYLRSILAHPNFSNVGETKPEKEHRADALLESR